MEYTLGTDPEFFLREKKTSKMISAIEIIDGTKDNPKELKSGGGLHHDNVAMEFSTKPHTEVNALISHIRAIFKDVIKEIPKNLEMVNTPSANFDDDQLECDEAKAFGCSPDYNAWTISMNEPPVAEDLSLRSCGGHIHVGFVEGSGNDFLLDPYGKMDTVKMMDLFHGITSVLLDNSPEAIKRRVLYGKAGCHRPTDYGVEYRVLSNFWFKSPMLVMMVDSLTKDVLEIIKNNKHNDVIDVVGGDVIQTTINEGIIKDAQKILDVHLLPLMSKDSKFYFSDCMEKIDTFDFNKEWEMET